MVAAYVAHWKPALLPACALCGLPAPARRSNGQKQVLVITAACSPPRKNIWAGLARPAAY